MYLLFACNLKPTHAHTTTLTPVISCKIPKKKLSTKPKCFDTAVHTPRTIQYSGAHIMHWDITSKINMAFVQQKIS